MVGIIFSLKTENRGRKDANVKNSIWSIVDFDLRHTNKSQCSLQPEIPHTVYRSTLTTGWWVLNYREQGMYKRVHENEL